MCLTIQIHYQGCDHKGQFIRPCREDGSLCGKMVGNEEWRISETRRTCGECFMLPDPRASQAPALASYRIGETPDELLVERYLNENVEAETQDLNARIQNLPLLESIGQHQGPNFNSSSRMFFNILSKSSLEVLRTILRNRLIPDFWLRVTRGENPSPAVRRTIINLQEVLLINEVIHRHRYGAHEEFWRIAMGYQLPTLFTPETLSDNDCGICGICRDVLSQVEDMGVPVKTRCNHVYHQECIKHWTEVAPNGDCPTCRTVLRIDDIVQEARPTFQGPNPEWLEALVRRVGPDGQPIAEQENISFFETVIERERLEVAATQQTQEATRHGFRQISERFHFHDLEQIPERLEEINPDLSVDDLYEVETLQLRSRATDFYRNLVRDLETASVPQRQAERFEGHAHQRLYLATTQLEQARREFLP